MTLIFDYFFVLVESKNQQKLFLSSITKQLIQNTLKQAKKKANQYLKNKNKPNIVWQRHHQLYTRTVNTN